jgi:hypothetical protein
MMRELIERLRCRFEPTKALGVWLFIVALLWGFSTLLVMNDMVTPLPPSLYYALGFGGPLLLIIGATLVVETRYSKFASIVCLLACAWLTLGVSPGGVAVLMEARQTPDYVVSLLILLFVVLADTAAVVVFRRVRKTI